MRIGKLIPSGAVFVAALLIFTNCATKPHVAKGDEPLYGTWANEEYGFGGVYVYRPDGTGLGYSKTTDPEPQWECRFVIETKSTDEEGNIYYHVLEKWTSRPYYEDVAVRWYLSIKIVPSGDVMESIASRSSYVDEITPGAPYWYRIHYRQ